MKLGADEERAGRQAHLQHAEAAFDPPPFDAPDRLATSHF